MDLPNRGGQHPARRRPSTPHGKDNMLEAQHWGLQLAQSEELQSLPQGPEDGAAYGAVAEMMHETIEVMKENLRELHD